MQRTHAILVAGMLGAGVTLLSTVPAYAGAFGMSDYRGTSGRATNCDCTAPGQAAGQKQQAPTDFAKKSKPASVPGNSGAGEQLQR